jgi:hypothetical protein
MAMNARRQLENIISHKGGSPKRAWRNHEVDTELEDGWLERANALPGVELISVCAGHPHLAPDKVSSWGGTCRPTLGIRTQDPNLGPRLAKLLEPIARVTWDTWGGKHGNVVTHVNGVPRPNPHQDPEVAKTWPAHFDHPATNFSINVSGPPNTGNQDELRTWWEAILAQLEALL